MATLRRRGRSRRDVQRREAHVWRPPRSRCVMTTAPARPRRGHRRRAPALRARTARTRSLAARPGDGRFGRSPARTAMRRWPAFPSRRWRTRRRRHRSSAQQGQQLDGVDVAIVVHASARDGHSITVSMLRASERRRGSGQQRPAWPGNAVRPAWPGNAVMITLGSATGPPRCGAGDHGSRRSSRRSRHRGGDQLRGGDRDGSPTLADEADRRGDLRRPCSPAANWPSAR